MDKPTLKDALKEVGAIFALVISVSLICALYLVVVA